MGVRLIVRPKDPPLEGAVVEWPFEFEQERILLGRGTGTDVSLPDRGVSTRHASLRVESGSRVMLIDHGSTNGTRVNGQALVAERPRALRDHDVLEIGPFRIEVRVGVAVSAPTSRERTVSLARRILEHETGERMARPRIVVMNGPQQGRELALPPPPARLRIGRAEHCDLWLDDADASREHAEIHVDLDGATLRDLGSKNGLEIAGRKVSEKRLKDRDEIVIGATVLAFEDPTEGMLKERESLSDLRLAEPTLPIMVKAPAAAAETPAVSSTPSAPRIEPPDPHREPPPPPVAAAPSWPRRSFTAEMAVLLLGALVLAASAMGLYYLVSSS
jgi:pSer/pThr/pTyr-binding forkhead associated (FHA) protein